MYICIQNPGNSTFVSLDRCFSPCWSWGACRGTLSCSWAWGLLSRTAAGKASRGPWWPRPLAAGTGSAPRPWCAWSGAEACPAYAPSQCLPAWLSRPDRKIKMSYSMSSNKRTSSWTHFLNFQCSPKRHLEQTSNGKHTVSLCNALLRFHLL